MVWLWLTAPVAALLAFAAGGELLFGAVSVAALGPLVLYLKGFGQPPASRSRS